MQDAAFLVVDVPAHETVLGSLTQQDPDMVIDLVGRPDASGPTHCYVVDFTIAPMSTEQGRRAKAALAPLYERLEAEQEGTTWHVTGRAPLANIQVPALRMIAGLYGLTQAPWLILKQGRAKAIMRPRDEASSEMLASLVRARLAQLHVEGTVWLEQLDVMPYDERRARLAAAETRMAK